MSKITTIIAREYLSRVKKKSFLIMTFLTPMLMIAVFLLPIWLMNTDFKDSQKIGIIDYSNDFQNVFVSANNVDYEFITEVNKDSISSLSENDKYDAVLIIPKNYKTDSILVFSNNPIPIGVKYSMQNAINSYVENENLISMNIDPVKIEQAKSDLKINQKNWEKQDSSSELNTVMGYAGAFIIYIFIFMYGVQLMRGTLEEKKDRIIEIIISSAKPFELMLGKVIGVAMVAFTQFGIWLLTIIVFLFVGKQFIMSSGSVQLITILASLQNVNSVSWILYFLFFFIGGYLLYGSLFAAIGAAVDSETDTQQFMLPITIPLALAFIFAQNIIQAPNGTLAVTLSLIPFTSPIVMMVRLGFGVPAWQMILSMLLLILTFLGTIYIGAKIYRIGILSYGKKPSYKDLWKWIRYK